VLPQHYTIPDGFALVVHEVDSAELWQSMRAGTTVPDTPWPDDGTACTDVVLLRHGDHGGSGDAGLHWDCVLCKTGIPKSIGAGGRGSRSFGHLSRHRGTGKHTKGGHAATRYASVSVDMAGPTSRDVSPVSAESDTPSSPFKRAPNGAHGPAPKKMKKAPEKKKQVMTLDQCFQPKTAQTGSISEKERVQPGRLLPSDSTSDKRLLGLQHECDKECPGVYSVTRERVWCGDCLTVVTDTPRMCTLGSIGGHRRSKQCIASRSNKRSRITSFLGGRPDWKKKAAR
jgi:hypothetical protein